MVIDMSDIIQKKNREECFRNYIREILRNREIDCDEEWWTDPAAQSELAALAGTQGNYVTDSCSMNIEGSEMLVFAVYQGSQDDGFEKEVKQRISSGRPTYGKSTSGTLKVFFVKDMKSRIKLEKIFTRDIICILVQESGGREVKLTGLNRMDMMQEPPVSGRINLEKSPDLSYDERNKPICGLVCTANLFQVVGLYNMLGDQIFKYNVRIGMKEMLGVDSAIRHTLESEPDRFWFKNNGITILVENPDFRIESAEELILDRIEAGGETGFSIVNGAQTINTAAQYFYGLEYQLESKNGLEKEALLKELDRAKKEARVLLRVIHIPAQEDREWSSSMAKEISVALNRQKPIKIEDITFTDPFVEKLVEYLDKKIATQDDLFRLVRRGEKTDAYRQMDLTEFSRARLACAGYPGEARSQSANELLKFREEEDGRFFANKIIFAEDWLTADASKQDKIFERDYKAVWYAQQIALNYEKNGRVSDGHEQDIQSIVKNGKWYFTAFLIQMANGYRQRKEESSDGTSKNESLPDFTDFTCDLKNLLEHMESAMVCFAEIVAAYLKESGQREKYGELDSNLFKKNDLFQDIMKELENQRSNPLQERFPQPFLMKCKTFAELLSLDFFLEETAVQPAVRKQENIFSTMPEKSVMLDDGIYPVNSDAEAFETIVEYILTKYPLTGEWRRKTDGWLTDDGEIGERGEKYFRGAPRQVYVNGKHYWIGTGSNTQTKCRQLRQLCELASVPQGCILWYKNFPDDPVFMW